MNSERTLKQVYGWIMPILLALGVVYIMQRFLIAPMIVDGASMEPTLHDRERIFVSKTITWTSEKIQRGEIVIIKDPQINKNYVKRVIGLPEEVIEMKNDQLFINGKRIDEPYLQESKDNAHRQGMNLTEDFGPIHIPKNHYFVMGDNRLRSIDSRNSDGFTLGFINSDRIIGKSKLVFFPPKNTRLTK